MSASCIWLASPIFFILSLAYIKKIEEVKRYKLMVDNYEDKILILTNELKDIASLNKYVTDNWQNTVKENIDVNNKCLELLNYIKDIDHET